MLSIESCGARANVPAAQTRQIQAAIDQCGAAGGGTVVIPPGTYVSGTLFFRSNVTLRLEGGAVLSGSTRMEDYPLEGIGFTDAVEQRRGQCLLCAHDVTNVAIEGRGTIDGNGGSFGFEANDRPFLVRFIRSSRISVTGVTLLNSAGWVSHYLDCEDVVVHGVTIRSHVNGNNDGIDIDSSRHVRVSDCHIDTGDDAICLKTTLEKPCCNVTITNCVIRSCWGAVKIGTESVGDVRNVVVSNCVIRDTNGGGLKILSVDGAIVENVLVSDVVMDNVSGPIFIRLGSRLRTYYAGQQRRLPGAIRNVVIRNVHGRVWEEGFPLWGNKRRAGICVTGVPEARIEGLTMENIRLTFPGGGTAEEAARRDVPEMADHYPEMTIFGTLPSYGLFLRHAQDVELRNVRVETRAADDRVSLVAEDVEQLRIDRWTATGGAAEMRMDGCSDVLVDGREVAAGAEVETT